MRVKGLILKQISFFRVANKSGKKACNCPKKKKGLTKKERIKKLTEWAIDLPDRAIFDVGRLAAFLAFGSNICPITGVSLPSSTPKTATKPQDTM